MQDYNLIKLPPLSPSVQTDTYAGGPRLIPTHILTTAAGGRSSIRIGRVVSMSPYLQVYKVITGEGPPILATPLRWGGPGQVGVVSTPTYTPGDFVAVLCHSAFPYGFILGSIPLGKVGQLPLPDKVSIIGFDFYNSLWYPVATALRYPDLSGRMFADASGLEQGFSAASGMAITIDPFLAQIRYDEATGLFVFAMDRLVRISGKTYQEWSAAHERSGWAASGLTCLYEGVNLTADEQAGAYYGDGSTEISEQKSDTSKTWEAPIDCVDFGQFPFHRLQQYSGALGFFKRSFLVSPPVDKYGQLHVMKDEENEEGDSSSSSSSSPPPPEIGYTGLFDEFLGVDGLYCARSAAGFGWLKTPIISAPRRAVRINGTGLSLNDAYRPFPIDNDTKTVKSVSYALTTWDVLLHSFVWFGSQNFIHGGDFVCASESDFFENTFKRQGWRRVMSMNGFEELESGKFMPPPEKAFVDVLGLSDGTVFNSVSYIAMLPDGGITIGDGYGSEIAMAGGKVFIDAPGGVFIRSGREVGIFPGSDFIVTADNSIDVAAKKDVRVAARHNLHLAGALAGGAHGVLIESRSTSDNPRWFFSGDPDAVGEGVTIGGIRLLCPRHVIAAYASNIHMVAHGTVSGGEVRVEACGKNPGRPNGRVVLVGDTVNHHVDCAVIFRYPAYGNPSTIYFAAKDHFMAPVLYIVDSVKCKTVDESGFDVGRYNKSLISVKNHISAIHPNAYDDIKTYSFCFTFRSVNQMCTKCIELIKPRWYRLAEDDEERAAAIRKSNMRINTLHPRISGSYPGYDPTGKAKPKEYDQNETILEDDNTAKDPPPKIERASDITINIKSNKGLNIYGIKKCGRGVECEEEGEEG